MQLPKNVRSKSGIWDLIPWLSNNTAQAIYPNVYVPKFVYENLLSKKQNPYHIALILHEEEHIKRQKEYGVGRWYLKYLSSGRFRFEEEITADVPKMKFLKSKKLDPFLDKRAKMLSSWLYFWPVPYKKARRDLEKIWNGLQK